MPRPHMQGCIKLALLMLDDAGSADFVERWANPDDRRVAGRRGRAGSADRTLAGRALLRALLAEEAPPPGGVWDVAVAVDGKPGLRSPDGLPGPPMSISHSRDLVAVAIGRSGNIGVDVEYRAAARPLPEIARIAFGPREIVEAGTSPKNFYRIWTLREAMAKAGGEGLQQAANGIDCVAGVAHEAAWTQPAEDGAVWRLACLEPVPGYSLALAHRAGIAATMGSWSVGSIDLRRLPAIAVNR